MKQQLTTWLCIAGGGAIGALSRYALGGLIQGRVAGDFPIGTLLVNLLGCFAFGLLFGWIGISTSHGLRGFLFTGLLGGFTTFSTFGFETVNLMQRGQQGAAFGYVAASVICGLFAAWLGLTLSGMVKPQ